MISVNATLVIQIIHFIILVFILNRLIFRPILKVINEREQYVADEKRRLTNLEEETAELIDKSVAMEKNVRRDAGMESSKLKREALVMAEEIFDNTRTEIAALMRHVDDEIESQLERAHQSLRAEAVLLADKIAEKVVGRRI